MCVWNIIFYNYLSQLISCGRIVVQGNNYKVVPRTNGILFVTSKTQFGQTIKKI